jgi:hypothetical protein
MPKIICACGRTVDTKPEWGGQWMSCPGCQGTLYAPFPGDKPAPPVPVIDIVEPPPPPVVMPTLVAPVVVGGPTRLCPWCAETVDLAATTCPFCKGDTNTSPAAARVAMPASPTSDPGGWMPLILGIIGFMFCQLLSPVAWAIGSSYEKDCRAKGLKPSGAGTAGKILGIVGTVFLFLILAFMVLGVIVQS